MAAVYRGLQGSRLCVCALRSLRSASPPPSGRRLVVPLCSWGRQSTRHASMLPTLFLFSPRGTCSGVHPWHQDSGHSASVLWLDTWHFPGDFCSLNSSSCFSRVYIKKNGPNLRSRSISYQVSLASSPLAFLLCL